VLTPIRKIASIILVTGIGVAALVSVWDYLAGAEEKWIHYVNPENPSIIGEYRSYEECSLHMKSHESLSGCRRIDGPYSAINAFANIVL
jgi:hypothetical protein